MLTEGIAHARGFLGIFAEKLLATAGVRLLLGLSKWIVLLHAARTLPTADFAKLAATLSLAEVLRVAGDCGTESIVYARVRSQYSRIPLFVKGCFQLRTLVSSVLAVLAAAIAFALGMSPGLLMLIALIVILSVESSALILLQRHFSRRNFACLVCVGLLALAFSIAMLLTGRAQNDSEHVLLILIPEIVVTLCAVTMVRKQLASLFLDDNDRLVRALLAVKGLLGVSALGAIVVIATSRLDLWIVMPMLGASQQASYSAGLRFVEPANLLLAYASTAFLSELGVRGRGGLVEGTRSLLQSITARNLAAFAMIQAVLGTAAYLAARDLFDLSRDTSLVAALLSTLLPVKLLSAAFAGMLYRLGRVDRVLIATLLNLACVTALSLTLGARLGVLWICVAAIAGETFGVAYQGWKLESLTRPRPKLLEN